MSADLDQLADMGFDREKAALALKQAGNLPAAIDWLDKNADKPLDELKAEDEQNEGMPAADAQANSMVCNDCGKKFRGMAQAQFHAEKSGHDDFSESAEELAPLTEEQKKEKLAEMRAALAEKRKGQQDEDKLAQKRNEEIRKKSNREQEDVKEELRRKEQLKDAQKKKQEKAEEVKAKQRIKEKIEADKAARKQKADEEKAMRANPAAYDPGAPAASGGGVGAGGGALAAAQQQNKSASSATEARLRLQTPSGNVMKTFPAETTLFEVAAALEDENGTQANCLVLNFPKKTFERTDFGMTVKEAGLVPSAAVVVK